MKRIEKRLVYALTRCDSISLRTSRLLVIGEEDPEVRRDLAQYCRRITWMTPTSFLEEALEPNQFEVAVFLRSLQLFVNGTMEQALHKCVELCAPESHIIDYHESGKSPYCSAKRRFGVHEGDYSPQLTARGLMVTQNILRFERTVKVPSLVIFTSPEDFINTFEITPVGNLQAFFDRQRRSKHGYEFDDMGEAHFYRTAP